MLQVLDLSAGYGGHRVIEGIGFDAPRGSVTALLGSNGTGKSTLLRAVAGLTAARGQIVLDGAPLAPGARAARIRYMPQDTGAASSLSVLEVVVLGRLRSLGLRVPEQVQADALTALAAFGLAPLSGRSLNEISGGQRQLTYLAQALFARPDVLLLDEPTAALDLRHQLIVLDHVAEHCRASGTIAIAAMHDVTLAARSAAQVICLNGGRVLARGAPRAVLKPALLERLYGVEAEILVGSGGALTIAPLRPCGGETSTQPDFGKAAVGH